MNGLLGAINVLLHPEYGRCGVDSHDRDEGGGDVNNINDGNSNRHDDENSYKNGSNDDENGDHEHAPNIRTESGSVSEKWSISQARKTSDAQSKVYDRRRKKPGGIDYETLKSRRIKRVRDATRKTLC